MNLRRKLLVWLRTVLHSTAFAGLILIAASWFVDVFVASVERAKAIDGAMKQSDSLVRLFELNTVDMLNRIDRTLLLLRKSFEDNPANFDLRKWAGQAAIVGDETFQLTLIGADGFQKATTLDYNGPPIYVGDRAHFQKQRAATIDELVISEPVMGRTSKRLSLQFSRRLHNFDGSFAGLILLSIDPNFVQRFYKAVDLGARGSIVIRNPEGVVMAAQGVPEGVIGRRVMQMTLAAALARSPSGHYWGEGAIDGENRLIAYRVSESFPLIFMVGLAEENILSEYKRHQTAYMMVASAVTILVLIGISFTLRYEMQLTRSQQDLQRLNREISEQNVLFDAALTNMSSGLALFNADGRLTVWNERYDAIYRMPRELVKQGASIYSIVKFCDQSGQRNLDVVAFVDGFRRELKETGRSRTTARLKDGRIISIVNTAIAGGGWVGIHEDITSQRAQSKLVQEKAAELEIMNKRFSAALSNMAQGLCMWDGKKRLIVWNERFAQIYKMPAQLLKVGTAYEDIVSYRIAASLGTTSDDPRVRARVAELVALPPSTSRTEELPDGRCILLTRQPMENGGWVTLIEDITERRRAEAEIVHLARHDALTGLPNRAEFNARLEDASRQMQRSGGVATVMMVDLDRFKAVNDTLGHLAGDEL